MKTLIDYKSKKDKGSKMFFSAEQCLQLGAYFGATHYRENGAVSDWQVKGKDVQPEQGAIIKLSPFYVGVGEYVKKWEDEDGEHAELRSIILNQAQLESAFAQFRHCLDVFFWMTTNGFAKIPEKENYRFDGNQLVSVTYVIQHVIAKPGLLNWYAKMAREGKSPEEERDKRAREGSLWHKNALFYSRGDKVDLTDAPESLSQVIGHLAQWQQKVKFKSLLLETTVANPELGYAGTLDAIAEANL